MTAPGSPYNIPKEGETMSENPKTSKAQQKAVNKYVKNNYDRINVTFPKGRKSDIQAAAALHNESVNAYIVQAVYAALERDNIDFSSGQK